MYHKAVVFTSRVEQRKEPSDPGGNILEHGFGAFVPLACEAPLLGNRAHYQTKWLLIRDKLRRMLNFIEVLHRLLLRASDAIIKKEVQFFGWRELLLC